MAQTNQQLVELLDTLGPAGKAANKIWANEQVRQALEQITKALPYNPDIPPELKQWLLERTS